jgi:DNA-binding GntR family transcriptional regulator
VLAAAASLGERFTADELARATGFAAGEVEPALDRLEWDCWVVVDARGYAFRAPIERAILLQEMVTPGQARRFRERSAS